MTPRERILAVLHGELPDRVPCAPDVSNMIPCRLTGKPFWDIYLYQDPPLWKAYIDAVREIGFDGFLGPVVSFDFGDAPEEPAWTEVIVRRTDERIITQKYQDPENGERRWSPKVQIYDRDQPATSKEPVLLGLPAEPSEWERVEGVREWPTGLELYRLIMEYMGDLGVMGIRCGTTLLLNSPEAVYEFHDDPAAVRRRRDELLKMYERRFEKIIEFGLNPDYITMGASGTLIWQSPAIFRELGLPILKRMSALCREAGIPSHVHACGPEAALVQIAVEETDVTLIDPLEVPPMGDCNLRELKQRYGDRIALKGNLHTTEVMLYGSADGVSKASRQAIEDAAAGGGFILATGDQCGRDTPLENLRAMVEACERWGRY